jgi:hypothetical protein
MRRIERIQTSTAGLGKLHLARPGGDAVESNLNRGLAQRRTAATVTDAKNYTILVVR